MMLCAVLLLCCSPGASLIMQPCALPQQEQDSAPQAKDRRQEWKDWWEQLSPEERAEMRRRMEHLRGLGPEQQAEMQRRAERIRAETESALQSLSPEERARIQALPPHEHRRAMEDLLRRRFDDRSKDFRQRSPQDWQRFRRMPLDQRLSMSRHNFSEKRLQAGMQKLRDYVEEGWLGARAVERLIRSKDPERMWAHIDQVRMWKKLDELDQKGLWEQAGISAEQRRELESLPPPEFFHRMRELTMAGKLPRSERDRRRPGPGGGPPPPGPEGGPPPGPEDQRQVPFQRSGRGGGRL